MFKRQRTAPSVPTFRVSAREAKRIQKESRATDRAARPKRQTNAQRRKAAREELQTRPGRRGWLGRGSGRMDFIEVPPELQGTSVQICGYWPFIAGSSTPAVGVPLGRHLEKGTYVCADPVFWFLSNLVLNPSAFVLGRPALGKSTLTRRMVTVLAAWGIVPMILSDTKPDYVELIRELDGQVIEVGRGRGHQNPLDFGPLMSRLQSIPDLAKRREAVNELRGRRQTTLEGLIALVRGGRVHSYERSILSEALRLLDSDENRTTAPLLRDVEGIIQARPDALRALARDRGVDAEYDERVKHLLDDLTALGSNGPFGDIFSEPTSTHIELGRPMVFDMSGVDDADMNLQAAVQSVSWAYGSAVVSAHTHLAEAGLEQRTHYFLVMDELWRMLRAEAEMVFFVDALTRLNRSRGIAQMMITHTMNDLKLATDELTSIAWGFVERSAMVFLGGLAESEMGNLEGVFGMSSREKSMITDWSAEGAINPETGKSSAPPGRGKFLLKIGKKPGTPFITALLPMELAVNDTNTAWADLANRHMKMKSGE